MRVDTDPLLVVENRWRRCRVYESRRTPRHDTARDGAFAYFDCVGRGEPVEAEAGIEDVPSGIECQRRVASRVIRAAREVLNAGYEGAEVLRVRGSAAPGGTAVV